VKRVNLGSERTDTGTVRDRGRRISAMSGPGPEQGRPRVDGLYVSAERETDEYDTDEITYRYFMRFYPDGRIAEASVAGGRSAQVARWLNRHRTDLSHGRCVIDGGQISFSLTSPAGVVDYWGHLSEDCRELHVESYSHINGHVSEETLTFEPLSQYELTCRALYYPDKP
jgi:hypothetical protein